MTAEAEGYMTQLARLSCRWLSKLAHIHCIPSPPSASCLCRERLNPFDSTVKLLIWRWVSAGSLSTLYFKFIRSLIMLRWGRGWAGMTNVWSWQMDYLGGCSTSFSSDSFPWSLTLVPVLPPQPTTLCLMYMQVLSLPNRGTGSILEGWWNTLLIHTNLIQT